MSYQSDAIDTHPIILIICECKVNFTVLRDSAKDLNFRQAD